MVDLSVSLNSVGGFEQLTFLTISAINAICAVYLVRHYLKMREKLTLLFVSFFGTMAVFWFFNFLVGTGILFFSVTLALEYTYLIGATFLAVIGIVMLGVKQLYALPPLVTILAFIQQTQASSNSTQMYDLLQLLYYNLTRQFLGNPWFITMKTIFPNFAITGTQFSTLLNQILDPIAPSTTTILGIYLALIVLPTTILFYILAWKNRSGRSLGFSLGLTMFILVGFLTSAPEPSRDLFNILTLIATLFFAVGIFGVFDKIMKREESPKRQVKKEKK